MIFQIISIVGAVLILAAYSAQHLKKITADMPSYQFLNLIGGACLCLAAIAARQVGFIMLEGAWTVLSAWGLVRVLQGLKAP